MAEGVSHSRDRATLHPGRSLMQLVTMEQTCYTVNLGAYESTELRCPTFQFMEGPIWHCYNWIFIKEGIPISAPVTLDRWCPGSIQSEEVHRGQLTAGNRDCRPPFPPPFFGGALPMHEMWRLGSSCNRNGKHRMAITRTPLFFVAVSRHQR